MKTILDTELCKIVKNEKGHQVFIAMNSKKWVANTPHSGDLKGLIGAMTLAIDVLAGKIWLEGLAEVEKPKTKLVTIEHEENEKE